MQYAKRNHEILLTGDLSKLDHVWRAKKAYISIITPDILKLALHTKTFSYQAMCIKTKRAGLPYHAEYSLQIFGTY